jgi:hypothetical protein
MATKKPTPGKDVLLEDVLLALQKTFSRVSAHTSTRVTEGNKDKALALIVGDVDFQMTLHVEPLPPEPGSIKRAQAEGSERPRFDRLRYQPEGGGIELVLKGRVSTDIRIKHQDAASAPNADVDPTGGA